MEKFKKLVLAGGSGQIGTALSNYFADKAEEIVILSRNAKPVKGNIRTVSWDAKNEGDWYRELEDADILVNLTGKNVNCRYTEKNKKEIFNSRTDSIKALAGAIRKCTVGHRLWIQFASATIYRHAEDRPLTEANGEIGEGFSVEVCKLWEKTFWDESADFKDCRKVILRTSLVLGKDDGVYPRLKNLVRFGLGGKQGNGRQWVSWIHERDVARMVEFVAQHPQMNGVINCTVPHPIKNKDFMTVLRKTLRMPFGLNAPAWLLEIGAVMICTETELILKSRWVLPERIMNAGFEFEMGELGEAVRVLIR